MTGITQIADVGRARLAGNLQFCDPGHLNPRQAVRCWMKAKGDDGHEGIFSAGAGFDPRRGAATMVRAADRSPTPVVAADYSGASW